MTKTNVFKKSVSLALAFTMLLSLFCIMSKTNVGAVTDRVSMYSSDVTFVKYGKVTRNIYIQTTDNASSQQVYVHYNYKLESYLQLSLEKLYFPSSLIANQKQLS